MEIVVQAMKSIKNERIILVDSLQLMENLSVAILAYAYVKIPK